MKLNSSRKLVVNYDMMVEEDRCGIPLEVEDQHMDLHIHSDDTQEEARDVQAYLADGYNDHFFLHNDLVDLGEARVAFDDNDEDEDHESDHEERQGFHCSNDDAHGDGGMGQVVVLLILHAFQDDLDNAPLFQEEVECMKDEIPRARKAFVDAENDGNFSLS